jgi:cation-transporting ATPase E
MLFVVNWFREGWTTDEVVIRKIVMSVSGSMVAMIPSGLYLMVSVTLFVTMGKLAGEKSLVQDSYSVETLARVDTLCLDKTGTITDGTMVVEDEIKYGDSFDSENIIANLVNAFPDQNQTAIALDKKYKITKQYEVEKTLPFSSTRKKSAVTFKELGTFALGAPEYLLEHNHKLLKELDVYTQKGYRVVMLCKVDDITDEDIVGKVTPISAFIIKDHIRNTASSTIKWFKENGVDVKIISGDNPVTVSAIAKEVGVENAENWVSLENMSLDEVEEAAKKYTVFGRVAPEQKASLIKALKNMGRTVAMTGDGVNDILAMKQADCSIAMGSGSDASRNVAQLVLMDDNFANMPSIVKEGRRVINNVQSVASLFLMKTIFAILLTATTYYPFTTRNLILFEIIAIGLPSVLLALQPNTALVSGSFLKNVFKKCVPAGLAIVVAALVGMSLTGEFSSNGEGVFGLSKE